MDNTLNIEINQTFEELVKVFSSFKEDQIDTIPFEGSWTAGQVAEHIIKAVGNLPEFLNSKVEATAGRPFDTHVAGLREMFLDFGTKMKSPDFILPGSAHHNKSEILQSFSTLKTQMATAAATLDLTLTCKSFEMPGFGFLTRTEWLNFLIAHTKRHTHQLKNIYTKLNS